MKNRNFEFKDITHCFAKASTDLNKNNDDEGIEIDDAYEENKTDNIIEKNKSEELKVVEDQFKNEYQQSELISTNNISVKENTDIVRTQSVKSDESENVTKKVRILVKLLKLTLITIISMY